MAFNQLHALQAVLSQTCDVICAQRGIERPEAFMEVEEFISANSREWREDVPNIDYADPFCRMAYLYMNTPVHAHLIEQVLRESPEVGVLVSSGRALRVCALGGGPGSELLGLATYLKEQRKGSPLLVDIALLDRVREWDESWHALKDGVDAELEAEFGSDVAKWPFVVSRSFLPIDLSDVTQLRGFETRFSQTDLYLVTYLVSELLHGLDGLRSALTFFAERSKSGALFLFVDRNEGRVRDAIRGLVGDAGGLEIVRESQLRGSIELDLKQLGEWYLNLEPLPRRRWLAYSALARKK